MKIESLLNDIGDMGALHDIIESTADLEGLAGNKIIDQIEVLKRNPDL